MKKMKFTFPGFADKLFTKSEAFTKPGRNCHPAQCEKFQYIEYLMFIDSSFCSE